MPEIQPNEGQKIALQNAVDKIYNDLKILMDNIDFHFGKIAIYTTLSRVTEYETSFYGENGWFWRLPTWNLAYRKFEDCRKKLAKFRDREYNHNSRSLVDQCDTCMDDMENYKTLCENIPVKKTMTEQFKAFVRLKSKLEALKDLAS
jgi:hypothetical protein